VNDLEALIIGIHQRLPGLTANHLAGHLLASDRSSYEVLADVVTESVIAPGSVLDLACGDGFLLESLRRRLGTAPALFGLDASTAEIEAARRRLADANATLFEARASAVPLPDASMDAVVCHLALGLFSDLDAVIREVCRLLAPAGTFFAVTSGEFQHGDAFETYIQSLRSVVPPEDRIAIGDLRVRSPLTLTATLQEAGLHRVRVRNFVVRFCGSADQLWQFFETTYDIQLLDASRADLVRWEFLRAVQGRWSSADATASFGLRLIQGTRA
jgi:SAM-dependent methyltransferase